MSKYIVVAKEIETGKSFRASIVLETQKEAQDYKSYLESFFTNERYTYSILEFDAKPYNVEAFGKLPVYP